MTPAIATIHQARAEGIVAIALVIPPYLHLSPSRSLDHLSLVVSRLIAPGAFWFLVPTPPIGVMILSWVELLLPIGLGVEMVIYADLGKGR